MSQKVTFWSEKAWLGAREFFKETLWSRASMRMLEIERKRIISSKVKAFFDIFAP